MSKSETTTERMFLDFKLDKVESIAEHALHKIMDAVPYTLDWEGIKDRAQHIATETDGKFYLESYGNIITIKWNSNFTYASSLTLIRLNNRVDTRISKKTGTLM